MFLEQLLTEFEAQKLDYALIGGMALVFHGIVRATMDIDLMVHTTASELEKAEKIMTQLGLISRIPVRAQEIAQFRREYIEKRNLLAWSFVDPSDATRQVDLFIAGDLKQATVDKVKWRNHQVKVLSLKDLLEMKQGTGRAQDQADVEKIKEKLKSKN